MDGLGGTPVAIGEGFIWLDSLGLGAIFLFLLPPVVSFLSSLFKFVYFTSLLFFQF